MREDRLVIGPSGKDVYACSFAWRAGGFANLSTALIEALSREEALGIAHLMAKNLPPGVMINVQSQLGPFDVFTRKFWNSYDNTTRIEADA